MPDRTLRWVLSVHPSVGSANVILRVLCAWLHGQKKPRAVESKLLASTNGSANGQLLGGPNHSTASSSLPGSFVKQGVPKQPFRGLHLVFRVVAFPNSESKRTGP